MNSTKLARIERNLAKFRRGAPSYRQLESLAKSLGRERCSGSTSRGKEPTYISTVFRHLPPLSIPHHAHDPGKGLAQNILDQLEEDIWEYKRASGLEGSK